ncbi:hypothetical protein Tco_1498130 [Tanacetum coccineum]
MGAGCLNHLSSKCRSTFYDLEVDLFPDVAFVSALISVAAHASQTKVYLFVSSPVAASSSAVDLLQLLNK